jgi:hypothetical protein
MCWHYVFGCPVTVSSFLELLMPLKEILWHCTSERNLQVIHLWFPTPLSYLDFGSRYFFVSFPREGATKTSRRNVKFNKQTWVLYRLCTVVCIFNFASSGDEFRQFAVQDKLFRCLHVFRDSEFQSRKEKSVILAKFLSRFFCKTFHALEVFGWTPQLTLSPSAVVSL